MCAYLFSTSFVNIDPFFLMEIYRGQKTKKKHIWTVCSDFKHDSFFLFISEFKMFWQKRLDRQSERMKILLFSRTLYLLPTSKYLDHVNKICAREMDRFSSSIPPFFFILRQSLCILHWPPNSSTFREPWCPVHLVLRTNPGLPTCEASTELHP